MVWFWIGCWEWWEIDGIVIGGKVGDLEGVREIPAQKSGLLASCTLILCLSCIFCSTAPVNMLDPP